MKKGVTILEDLDKLEKSFTAHDVRKLKPCERCKGIGYGPVMLVLSDGHYHGVCVVEMLTNEEILALPKDERRKLRLNEAGVELMRKLVEAERS